MSLSTLTGGPVYAQMKAEQRTRLDDVKAAADRLARYRLAEDTLTAELHAAVHDAMTSGVPADLVAERSGLSVPLVRKIRRQVASSRS